MRGVKTRICMALSVLVTDVSAATQDVEPDFWARRATGDARCAEALWRASWSTNLRNSSCRDVVVVGGDPAARSSVTDAVAWLESEQNPAGSWGAVYDFVDTCTAMDALTEADASCAEVGGGAGWLAGQAAGNYEYLARQIGGLAGAPGYEAVAASLAQQLLSARNASHTTTSLPNWPEGGWGVAEGYETDCLTTALAMLALDATGFNGGFAVASQSVAVGTLNIHEWDIPAEATRVNILITVAGSTVHLRMAEGSPPLSGMGFSLTPGSYWIAYPDSGLPFTPGHNYIVVHNIGAAPATYSLTAGYETPTFDTFSLLEVLDYLREAQNGDGGWGLQRGGDTELYTTLHTLLALLQFSNYDVAAELAAGFAYLHSQQLPDGSFGYDGTPISYVTALAALALVRSQSYPFDVSTEAAIDALRLMQEPDGSWDEEPYHTALGVLALWDHNQTPTVDAGSDQYIVDAGNDCLEDVTLSGSAGDVDGTIESYVWRDNDVEVATGPSPTVTLGIGTHFIELTVTDDGGKPTSDTVTIDIGVAREAILEENMDSDPGWSKEGLWAWGVPLGNDGWHGGVLPNGPDPTSGCTGTRVYGYNLAGGYEDNLPAKYLTTPAIDCSGHTGVRLSFCRWLNVEESQYDHASLEVSNDGVGWTTLFDHVGPTLIETAWSLQTYDLSAVADGQASVYVRWAMGPTDYTWNYGGWNIDDVVITGVPYDPAAATIVSSTPADGYIDPRRPEDAGGNPEGIEQITITFDKCVKNVDGMALSRDAFSFTSTSGGATPTIASVDTSANPTVVLTLSGPIEAEQWSTLTATVANASGVVAGAEIDIGALPCDVDQSGNVNISDATVFVGEFNALQRPELIDTNRSGNVNISDATEFATLFLNEWSGRSLPPRP